MHNNLIDASNDGELQKRADGRNAEAMFALGKRYLATGRRTYPGTLQSYADLQNGIKWVQRAVNANHPPAIIYLSEQYLAGNGGYVQDYAEAERLLSILCSADNINALLRLGLIYVGQADEHARYSAGLELLARAAHLGSAAAALHLGEHTLKTSQKISFSHIERACAIVSTTHESKTEIYGRAVKLYLSTTHLRGRHLSPINRKRIGQICTEQRANTEYETILRCIELLEAISQEENGPNSELIGATDEWWETAAGVLARIHLFSTGTHWNSGKGYNWLSLAFKRGDNWARYHTAYNLFRQGKADMPDTRGDSRHPDVREAANIWHELTIDECWELDAYRIAASTNYALCNLHGHGIGKDTAEACEYLRRSALAGDAIAQYELANYLANLSHKPTHLRDAAIFINLAAALDYPKSRELRNYILAMLPKPEVEIAQRESRNIFERWAIDDNWFAINSELAEIRSGYQLPL